MGVVAVNSQAIREEVAELLGARADTLDPGADLISQGLDSIRMMSLAGRWRKQGIDIDFAALAAEPTIAAWSELLSAAGGLQRAETSAPQDDSEHDQPFGLAPMQHAMWIGREDDQQLGGVAGHLYVEFDGHGVDVERLTAAATALAARHPMLRVQFLADGTQRIKALDGDFPVTVTDLRDLPADQIAEQLAATQRRKAHQQLTDQVFELSLTLLPDGKTRLHVDLDMQAADAMSYRTLMADLAALYRGVELAPLAYTYREYRMATTQSAQEPNPRADADRQWWGERLPELPDPPRLPLVPVAEQNDPRHTTRRWHWLAPDVRDALYAAARRRGITPAMALAASFSDALACWSAGQRFLLNVPLFGRDQRHADVDRLVGDFTSSLLLDVDLTDAATATARCGVLQDAFRSAAAHSEYSGLEVLRDLSRHRGTQVLAPVVFTSALGLGELFGSAVLETFGTPGWINSQGPQVMLDAQVTEFNGGVLVNWDVREDAFPDGIIDAMFARHIAELERLAGDDTAWEAPTPEPMSAAQRAVRDAANSRTAAPSGAALHTGFFASAAARPTATAMIGEARQWTYAELAEEVSAVASALQVAGIKPGDTVAVLGPKGAEQIIALLAIMAAGGVYLPIGVDQPADRTEKILATGGVRMALYCGDLAPSWKPSLTVTEALRIGRRAEGPFVPAATDPHELAYVLFTSGSTGEPKGVEVTHDAAMNTAEFLYGHFDIGPADRCLALATLECDLSVLDMFATLATGGSIVVVDEPYRRDPDRWAALIAEHGVTVLNFLPGWLEMLVEVGAGRLDTVRVVLTGGDWVRTAMVRHLQAQAPGVRVAGLGGATETAIHATIFEAGELPDSWSAVPYGVPFTNNACRVVNEAGQDCPDWVAGELWFTGRGIASGYRGRADLTADRFVRYAGRTWYRSGDLARYRPDGILEFVGRADHRVKISGYRIELGDVEAALQRVPGVRAAVAGVVSGGERGHDVLAALVSVDDAELTAERISAAVAELVPPHMIPRQLQVVAAIPFTVGGKTDRRAAAGQLAALVQAADGAGRAQPETTLERALVAIVSELLAVEAGVEDDFFELGGDSVLATATVARIRKWLDTPTVGVPDIFAARTVRALAQRLTGREDGSGRLDMVAELYLEIAEMNHDDVLTALDPSAVS
ncbi:non-ribosomal peptide synthetase [Mycolicibacterium mucogenicum]|uniref:Phenyloxazoline synthase MbtB n=1 Tax=Mycolicibacterium mucogenicum DSM 44124 TaxID=1226753 RepID=A0A8H2JAK8_MYCMU|nr:non-ribosomal peptide synthetase [Mycolicibacterium mucogenicum]KAB7754191.1 peptide synthetase [Mycolicibacterium mucogenicum DSM 44124]QPG70965.1 non-ribosomal peptide synthetase [Mycolicibacterium mucogenicum DSM 44124]